MTKEQEPLEDYTTYSGSYQAGQLLHEEGEIDLDELNKGDTGKTPLLIKAFFGVIIGLVCASGYFVFIYLKPKFFPPKIDLPKVDKFIGETISKLDQYIKKDLKPAMYCSFQLAQARAEKVKESKVKEECLPLKGNTNETFQLSCKDKEDCKEVALTRCQGSQCAVVDGISYRDFNYELLLRYTRSIDLFVAYQRLLIQAKDKMNQLEKEGKDRELLKTAGGNSSLLRKKVEDLLKGEGFQLNDSNRPYFSLSKKELFQQVVESAQKKEKESKSKSLKNNQVWGGSLKTLPQFPVEVFQMSSFSEVSKSQNIARLANARLLKYDYSSSALNFWGNIFLQRSLLKCAQTAKEKVFEAQVVWNVKKESIVKDQTKVTTGTDEATKQCIQTALQKLPIIPPLLPEGSTIEELQFSFRISL